MPDHRLRIEAEYEAMESVLSALPERPLSSLDSDRGRMASGLQGSGLVMIHNMV
jgi:hypothetical protein